MSNTAQIIAAVEFAWLVGATSLIALFRADNSRTDVTVESIFGAPNPDTLNVRITEVSA